MKTVRRERLVPRPDWQAKVERLGMDFHTSDGQPYWCEAACYAFTTAEIDIIETATAELHALCLEAVERLVGGGDLERLGIPEMFWHWIGDSWRRHDPGLFGRFDLAYDGSAPPKMLEYNADTPTALLEAAVIQWYWLEEVRPGCDQFNLIHERLIDEWKAVKARINPAWRVYFTGVLDEPEDLCTVEYMRDVCGQAGLACQSLDIAEIGWNGQDFTDLAGRPIRVLFKLYPWEWLLAEEFAPHLLTDRTAFIEAPWKMVLSNKAILPILWEMFPDHPNLLPASFRRSDFSGPCVQKSIHGREGNGVSLLAATDAGSSAQCIWQALCPLPVFDNQYAIIGSWMIGNNAAGIGMREDPQPITGNSSVFVPHYLS
jgi:glutathionylspermidine synthase